MRRVTITSITQSAQCILCAYNFLTFRYLLIFLFLYNNIKLYKYTYTQYTVYSWIKIKKQSNNPTSVEYTLYT